MMIKGIVCFGDSIIAGTGASDRQKCCAKLVKHSLNVPVALKGKNRDTSEMGLRRIFEDVLTHDDHSHVVILIGNNDCWFNSDGKPYINLQDFQSNLTEIVRQVRKNGQMPLLCNLQPIDNTKFFSSFPIQKLICEKTNINPFLWQQTYSNAIQSLSGQMGVVLIDIRGKLGSQVKQYIGNDGLHPNDKGHAIIANEIILTLHHLDNSLQIFSKTPVIHEALA